MDAPGFLMGIIYGSDISSKGQRDFPDGMDCLDAMDCWDAMDCSPLRVGFELQCSVVCQRSCSLISRPSPRQRKQFAGLSPSSVFIRRRSILMWYTWR